MNKEFKLLKNNAMHVFETKPAAFNGMLLQTVWHTFLTEEITAIDKKLKSPTIDLKRMKQLVFSKVRNTFSNRL